MNRRVSADGFTFNVYNKDSPYGEFGPIRCFGEVQYKAKKPQYWRVTIDVTILLGSSEVPIKEIYNVADKAKLSEISVVIEKYFNDTLSRYTDAFYKRLRELNITEKPKCLIKCGVIEAWVMVPCKK